jgi:RNA polymerase sigma-70 factor (ECF subfamily)
VNPPDKTTEELVREIKRGLNVEENFRQLFERHYAQIRRYFGRRRFSPEDSYELTQETFLSVYKGLKDFRQESSFESWMFSIAENIRRSELERRKARKRNAPLISLDQESASETDEFTPLAARIADRAPDQLDRTIEKEKLQKLYEAMRQLPEQMRRCTELRIIHDFSYKEIAELMEISINTVKAHLHQAKKELSERLKPYFGEIEL